MKNLQGVLTISVLILLQSSFLIAIMINDGIATAQEAEPKLVIVPHGWQDEFEVCVGDNFDSCMEDSDNASVARFCLKTTKAVCGGAYMENRSLTKVMSFGVRYGTNKPIDLKEVISAGVTRGQAESLIMRYRESYKMRELNKNLNKKLVDLLKSIKKGDIDSSHQIEADEILQALESLSLFRADKLLVFLRTAKIALGQKRIDECYSDIDAAMEIVRQSKVREVIA